MKVLNLTTLGFLGTAALGVLIAWSAAVPCRTAGERVRGNCKYCLTETFITCGPRVEGDSCGKQALQCIYLPGDGICYKGSPSPCVWDTKCQANWHEACVGG